jgi:signal transduction histidine kinase/CheY-like chemotaxis protein
VSDPAPHHLSEALRRDLADRCLGWLEAIADGCVVLDATRVVRYHNAAFATLWARGTHEMVGEPLANLLTRPTDTAFQHLCEQAFLHGRFQQGELAIGERWCQVRVHPLSDGVLGLVADLTGKPGETEPGRLQERLEREQKRESLDVVVGGVAHDFNNLLVGVLNGAELLLQDLPQGSPLRETAEMIAKAGERARDVARQVLAYVGKGRSARQPFDLNRLVRENLPILKAAFPQGVRVEAALDDKLPLVHADPGQMQQVVMNLLVNAAEALPPAGGTIRVTTGVVMPGDPRLTAVGGRTTPYVMLEVADTGSGMAADVQARIFEPFFTTKPKGHGLGLAAVKNILRGHDGLIHLDSAPGGGTTIQVYLPGIKQARPDAPAAGESAAPPEVLVVDDEPFVRDVVKRMLRQAGFLPHAAGGGAEALTLVRENPTIALVILDMRMPGMDGWETFQRLGDARPDLGVILTSGYDGEELPEVDDPRLIGFLPKPYVFEDLVRLVQQGLARAARS